MHACGVTKVVGSWGKMCSATLGYLVHPIKCRTCPAPRSTIRVFVVKELSVYSKLTLTLVVKTKVPYIGLDYVIGLYYLMKPMSGADQQQRNRPWHTAFQK